jgi:hypothetical protein
MYHDRPDQPEGVDQQVPFSPLDALARIVATRPPFAWSSPTDFQGSTHSGSGSVRQLAGYACAMWRAPVPRCHPNATGENTYTRFSTTRRNRAEWPASGSLHGADTGGRLTPHVHRPCVDVPPVSAQVTTVRACPTRHA